MSSCFVKQFRFIKHIMFVGDSLGSNQWQSLTCMLHTAVPQAPYNLWRKGAVSTFAIPLSKINPGVRNHVNSNTKSSLSTEHLYVSGGADLGWINFGTSSGASLMSSSLIARRGSTVLSSGGNGELPVYGQVAAQLVLFPNLDYIVCTMDDVRLVRMT
ncbi:hypothetical protein RJ639_044694 [Escallonia herrerae]|uniref:Trichome birefringence-like C-terminal domain-containing protein n=1 Tax=Escallonia herrerae TaxID=1293975 RepID=A0AA89B1Q8_9ASTE|nr:hypothetical protein RJ639_044694 [Escallonia herrerae]